MQKSSSIFPLSCMSLYILELCVFVFFLWLELFQQRNEMQDIFTTLILSITYHYFKCFFVVALTSVLGRDKPRLSSCGVSVPSLSLVCEWSPVHGKTIQVEGNDGHHHRLRPSHETETISALCMMERMERICSLPSKMCR